MAAWPPLAFLCYCHCSPSVLFPASPPLSLHSESEPVCRVTFNHTHREEKKGGIVAGWKREWDQHREKGEINAAERRREKKKKKIHTEVRKMEKSLFSWKPAERRVESDKKDEPPSPLSTV